MTGMKAGLILLCMILLGTGSFPFFGNDEKPSRLPSSEVSLSALSYHWQGTTRPVDYRLELSKDGKSVTAEIETSRGWVKTTHDVSVMLAAERILERYAVEEWDGFNGSRSDVLDGEGFSLSAEFLDSRQINASGYNRFPPNYYEVSAALNALAESALQTD